MKYASISSSEDTVVGQTAFNECQQRGAAQPGSGPCWFLLAQAISVAAGAVTAVGVRRRAW